MPLSAPVLDSLKLLLLLHTPVFISAPGSSAKFCVLSDKVFKFQFRTLSVWWLHVLMRSGFVQRWCVAVCPWQGDSGQCCALLQQEQRSISLAQLL